MRVANYDEVLRKVREWGDLLRPAVLGAIVRGDAGRALDPKSAQSPETGRDELAVGSDQGEGHSPGSDGSGPGLYCHPQTGDSQSGISRRPLVNGRLEPQ